jgi:flagellar protein FlbD
MRTVLPLWSWLFDRFFLSADNLREGASMIELTRLNGRPMMLNSDLIKTAESSPDTMLTLINGEKLIVRENIGEVVERVLVYRARLLAVVARRMARFSELERAVGLAGLDLAGLSAAPEEPTPDSGEKKPA